MVVIIPIGNKKKKEKERDFSEATNINMWDTIEFGYEFPKIMINGVSQT